MNLEERGYMGKILIVDLTDETYTSEKISTNLARKLLGGKGIGTYLLLSELKAGTEPLSPENVLIFGTGPFNGTIAPSSSKFIALTKSPATGTYLDCYCGGPFGNKLKSSGYDFLIIKGKSNEQKMLVIDNEGVRFVSAVKLWGKTTTKTTEIIKKEIGKGYASVVIGPAGERLSPIAGVMSGLRIAARGGLGAVMGSKNLKAIAVNGNKGVTVYNREKFKESAWKSHRTLRMSAEIQRLNRDGSVNILELINASGGLPTHNFKNGSFENSIEIEGSSWREKSWIQDTACDTCPIACSKIGLIKKGKYKNINVDGPEYETVFSLGSNCGVTDHDVILAVNHIADQYGVDTISLGGIIGFVMELFEKGLISIDELEGIDASWGNDEALIALGEKICQGEGIGKTLEKGVKRLSEEDYPEGKLFAMHVKGLELPAYLPRAAKGIALAYAVSERGACHLHGAPVGELLGAADPLTYEGKAELVRSKQLDVAIIDSTIHCYFTDFGLTLQEVYEMLEAVTGFDFEGINELEIIAERIINLTRLFNIREGFSRKDDILPLRSLREPITEGPATGEVVNLERLLDDYYRIMNWDYQGYPNQGLLDSLDLGDLLAEISI